MALNSKWYFSAKFLLPFLAVLLIFGCASIQKPMGGPRDRTPPKLLLATPANPTRNFAAKQIKLDFDEYFKLNNPSQEITMSPSMDTLPEYKVRKKSLVVDIRGSLAKNTTYVINFGKSIQDVNESNQLKNFTYVFSTGPHIDSLSISGTVVNTQTSLKEKDVTVMLFPADKDTAFFGKKKPTIFTTTDSAGNFTLANLHDGQYKIYALKETAVNRIYQDGEDIAFLKKPINLNKDTSNITLSLFKQTPDNFRVNDRHFDPDGKMVLVFNRPVEDPSIKILHPAASDEQKIVEFTKTRDTALVYLKNTNFDSISVAVLEKGKPIDTVGRTKAAKESYERTLSFLYNLNGDGKLKPGSDLIITAAQPIESFDQNRLILLEDSVAQTNYTLTKDPANPKKFALKYRWKQNARYELQLNEGAFTNIYGDKNKRLIRQLMVNKPDNYGTINLKVNVPDTAKSYIVEMLDNTKQVVRTDIIKKSTIINYINYQAGKYQFRVIYDDNNNGRWDSGNVKKNLFPENIYALTEYYTIRPNWEDEQTIDVPKETSTP